MSEVENEYQVQLKSEEDEITDFPKEVVIIPIVNSPIFPGMIAPIVRRKISSRQNLMRIF